jgi:hypothetical protein
MARSVQERGRSLARRELLHCEQRDTMETHREDSGALLQDDFRDHNIRGARFGSGPRLRPINPG